MSWPSLGGAVGNLPHIGLPEDWGFDMTLCIAAICRQENQLVLGTDLMLSTDWMSSDTQTLKAEPLAPRNRWVMMFAGDPTVRSQVAETAEAILAKQESDELPNVVAACLEAFRAALKV